MTHQLRSWFLMVRQAVVCCLFGFIYHLDAVMGADQIVRPTADGTIVDGGIYGPFDGVAEAADWTFNDSGPGYEGAITLSFISIPNFESRVVWEYNLSAITVQPPVVATFRFHLRGAARFPAPPAGVQVYSYPADLMEKLGDFSAGPAQFHGEKFVVPYQPATTYEINVNSLINEALAGSKKVAFRFQIDPGTAPDSNQAFMDALDSDPTSKPFITIYDRIPGDFDNDHDVDVHDYALFVPCIAGPNQTVVPACRQFDVDLDGDVDLADFCAFQQDVSLYAH